LRNAAGQFVSPTTASLQAGERTMKPSAVPGVLGFNPGSTDPAAYPLTALSYGVASPSTLDAAAGKDYAAFLRYAAGPGQQLGIAPGQLPLGMAPLPDTLKAQTAAAAAAIEAETSKNPGGPSLTEPTNPESPGVIAGGTPGPADGSNAPADTGGTATKAGGGVNVPGTPAAGPSPGKSTANSPRVATQNAGVRRSTPALPAPVWVGGLLLATLICGALAAASSPVLSSPMRQRLRAALPRRLGKGVMPTER
jgi:hypothetical protein